MGNNCCGPKITLNGSALSVSPVVWRFEYQDDRIFEQTNVASKEPEPPLPVQNKLPTLVTIPELEPTTDQPSPKTKKPELTLPVQNKPSSELVTIPELEATTDDQFLKTEKPELSLPLRNKPPPELEPTTDEQSPKTKKPESSLPLRNKQPKQVTFLVPESTTDQESPKTKKPESPLPLRNKPLEPLTILEHELETDQQSSDIKKPESPLPLGNKPSELGTIPELDPTTSPLSLEEPKGPPSSQEKPTAPLPSLETVKPRHLKRIASTVPWVGSVLQTKTSNFEDFYTCERQLGAGEFGRTFLCVEKATGKEYACKSIEKRKIISDVDAEDVRREIQIMHHLTGQQNVVSIIEAYEDAEAVHVVMELYEGGDLSEAILWGRNYGDRKAATLIRKIVEAVEACHLLGVMHRDIKLDNFLFVNWDEDAPLKIIDFGLSTFFKPGEKFSDVVGTPYYVAPEVFRERYGPEADIWSAGVILYFLLTGSLPFKGDSEEEIVKKVVHDHLDFSSDPWPRISEGAKDLVMKMLDKEPSTRISARDILGHPWVQLGSEVLSRLKPSSEINSFRKEAIRLIAQSLSEKEIAGLKEMFKRMDNYKRGKITYKELMAELERFGDNVMGLDFTILRPSVYRIHNRATISYGEFLGAALHLKKKLK